ncbi:MAG TPA: outer membrane lipoprotein carrier protein LolA [Puia sp.]|jgi:outer membrane lipoprotein-sorting protein
MRKCCLGLICILLAVSVKAQYAGFTLVRDQDNFKLAFNEATRKTNSIKSDFIQEKNLSMLSDKITSRGKFWFKKENRVRMEYTRPFDYLLILNGGRIYVKDGQKENKVQAGSNKVFQQVNRILLDCVGGTVLSNPDFQTRVFENAKSYLIELAPVAKNLKDLYQKINIFIDKKDYTASAIDMFEVSGDNSSIRFLNKELNANIPDTLFTIP